MNWSKGFSASFYATIVDVGTWVDTERIEITDGKVNRSLSDLQESAQIGCVRYDQSQERWLRICMDVTQNGDSAHVPMFTGLAVSPDRDINGNLTTNSVVCYSVLKPAQDVLLQRGWYAGKGLDGAELVKDLLSVTPAPKTVTGNGAKLTANIIAEDGESNLSMAVKILNAIDWRIRIQGDGTIEICPQPTSLSARFDNLENDSVEPRLKASFDWYELPNVYRVISGNKCAIARDSAAIKERGREIWVEDKSPAFNGSESITMYAERKLQQAQIAAYTVSYDRRFHPDVRIGDLVELHYPAQGIDNIFRVTSQAIDLRAGARTSEGVERYEQAF